MPVERSLWAGAITICLFFAMGSVKSQTNPCAAAVFVLQDLVKDPAVASPDGRYRVVLSADVMRVYAAEELRGTFQLRDLSGSIFVKWSPDSQAFYVMWSNGGAVGAYAVRAFRVIGTQVEELLLTRLVEREFERHHPCAGRGHNVYSVRWLKNSEKLLLALQVYPTSDCGKEAGLYRGYLVRAADGMILRRYSERQLKAIWPAGCPSDILSH
jgi:hypothetical protein